MANKPFLLGSIGLDTMERFFRQIQPFVKEGKWREAYEKIKGFTSATKHDDDNWITFVDHSRVQEVCNDMILVWDDILVRISKTELNINENDKQEIKQQINNLNKHAMCLATYGLCAFDAFYKLWIKNLA